MNIADNMTDIDLSPEFPHDPIDDVFSTPSVAGGPATAPETSKYPTDAEAFKLDSNSDEPVFFDGLVDSATKPEVTKIAPADLSLETPILNITFKAQKVGDIIVDPARGFLLNNVFNSIADRLCMDIAESVILIQDITCKDEGIADGTALRPSQMMDRMTGKLIEQFAENLTDAQKHRVEEEWAKIVVHNNVLVKLGAKFDELRPTSRTGLQYAYVGASAAENTGFVAGTQIVDPAQAIDFRIKNSAKYRAICGAVRRRRNGGATIEAMRNGDPLAVLPV